MAARRFVIPLLLGGVGYLGLIGLMAWIHIDGRERHLALVYTVLPVLPGLIMLGAVMTAYREMDELERRVQGEAAIIGFALSLLLFVAYGLLQSFSGFPPLNLGLAAALMMCAWGVGVLMSRRRYR